MGSPKGSGFIERRRKGRRTLFRARRTVKGRAIVGPWRASYEAAQDDRKRLAPASADYRLTVEELIGFCIERRYPRDMAPQTIATHASVLRTHVAGTALGSMDAQAVRPHHFQDWLDGVRSGPQTVRKAGSVVSRAFREARRLRIVSEDPCAGAVYPRLRMRRSYVLDAADLALLADPADLLESMLVVSLHTMLRRSEVCGLKWSEIVGGSVVLERDKTDDRRAVPLSPQAAQIVSAQPRRSEFVFTREDGSPTDPDWYSKEWRRWRDAHGLDPRVRLHDLRGTGITILLAEGYDLKTVQGLARHRSARTTLDIYAQAVDSNKREAVSALQKHTAKAHQAGARAPKTG